MVDMTKSVLPSLNQKSFCINMSSPPLSSPNLHLHQEASISWPLFQEEANVFFDREIFLAGDISSSSTVLDNSDQNDLWAFLPQINTSFPLEDEERNVVVTQGEVGLDSDLVFHQKNSRLLAETSNEKMVTVSEDSSVKKQEHNARERERRMKLSSSYLALRSLLPNSRRSKKRWSSSIIIEKVLDYIPCLEKEIESSTEKKKQILGEIKSEKQTVDQIEEHDDRTESAPAVVSVVDMKGSEVIIQICIKSWSGGEDSFSNMIRKVEEQGITILSASTAFVCDQRFSCHLHVQMKDGCGKAADEEDSLPILRDKVLSWLRH